MTFNVDDVSTPYILQFSIRKCQNNGDFIGKMHWEILRKHVFRAVLIPDTCYLTAFVLHPAGLILDKCVFDELNIYMGGNRLLNSTCHIDY